MRVEGQKGQGSKSADFPPLLLLLVRVIICCRVSTSSYFIHDYQRISMGIERGRPLFCIENLFFLLHLRLPVHSANTLPYIIIIAYIMMVLAFLRKHYYHSLIIRKYYTTYYIINNMMIITTTREVFLLGHLLSSKPTTPTNQHHKTSIHSLKQE